MQQRPHSAPLRIRRVAAVLDEGLHDGLHVELTGVGQRAANLRSLEERGAEVDLLKTALEVQLLALQPQEPGQNREHREDHLRRVADNAGGPGLATRAGGADVGPPAL
eukprot:CAMPEP_0204592104 /NCGR_PEP_ID=MMETSP0661-20131031/50749_1 /ASSEMBLY_ACC=CAM_ASM_000606 /TAXON_ID=109239 /ORGANISM="Alexandrium margalefi, Strain AMGDE01CS-322" /LENGTH=107 /DNA_ID=CAMNT_0051602289 /DNA_START=116 /DNA_END=435 /DNA_ORIENTATION=+